MTALTTTQRFFDEHNMVQGSLSFLEIELKNAPDGGKPTHKYWITDITAAASDTPDLIAGEEYEIKDLGSGTNAADASDWASIGVKKVDAMGDPAVPAVGDKFIAEKKNVLPGGKIPFGSDFVGGTDAAVLTADREQFGLQTVIQNVSSRASIVYIGIANKPNAAPTLGAPGKGKVRLILENRGYQNDEGMDHDRGPNTAGVDDYTSARAETLQKYLNLQNGLTEAADSMWVVKKFVF